MKPTTNKTQLRGDKSHSEAHSSQLNKTVKGHRPHKIEPKPIYTKEATLSPRELTSTETKIVNLLSDGFAHNTNQLYDCLLYSDDRKKTISMHVMNINRKIHPYRIISISTQGGHIRKKNLLYILVRLIRNDE